jgi:primosomal protein N' (replication factor Y)
MLNMDGYSLPQTSPAYARLLLNLPAVYGLFDYAIPPDLQAHLRPGNLVLVPFGRQQVQGVVFELLEQPQVAATRPIEELLDPEPVLTEAQRALLLWLEKRYLYPASAFLPLMLPPGLLQYADSEWRLNAERLERWNEPLSPIARRLVALLKDRQGSLRGRQIARHFRGEEWQNVAQRLLKKGLLERRSILAPRTVRPKWVRTAELVSPDELAAEIEHVLPKLARLPQARERRAAVLRLLLTEKAPLPLPWIYAQTRCTLNDLKALEAQGWIRFGEQQTWRDPLEGVKNLSLSDMAEGPEFFASPTLTPDQEQAWQAILESLQATAAGRPTPPILLHGVTGSGKTELYLRAVEETLKQGRQAIVLVPEIALTPQTVRRFLQRFPGQVGLIHSRLSEGERYDTWRRARAGQLRILIGPRSALFLPLPSPGLIVVDESHDSSYYPSDPPFYHTVTAAQAYARFCHAACILGSATPSVIQQYQAQRGEIRALRLPHRIHAALPEVQVVDMRRELREGVKSIFSRPLTEALAGTLARGEQAILFLNRRGAATYVFCRACGHVLKCPRCEVPLTLHLDENQLLCHYCGYRRQAPNKCPACGSPAIRAYGLGVERVVQEMEELFPQARLLRWDRDTARGKHAYDELLQQFASHQADVLIGTQMLAKGLDLPLVTLVGIILADVGLNLPDPFAAERVFQVLTQVAGRAGRSARGGQVILQTYMPEHYVIQHVVGHEVEKFYQRELQERRRLNYPPFTELIRLELRQPWKGEKSIVACEEEAQRVATLLRAHLQEAPSDVILNGPLPCVFARLGGYYRQQIVLRGTAPQRLLHGALSPARLLERGWRIETEPISLL